MKVTIAFGTFISVPTYCANVSVFVKVIFMKLFLSYWAAAVQYPTKKTVLTEEGLFNYNSLFLYYKSLIGSKR